MQTQAWFSSLTLICLLHSPSVETVEHPTELKQAQKSLFKERKVTLSLITSTSAQIGCDSCPSAGASPETPWLSFPEPMWSKPGKKNKNLSPMRESRKVLEAAPSARIRCFILRRKLVIQGKTSSAIRKQASDWRGAGNFSGVKRSSHITMTVLQNSSQGSYLWGCAGPAASGRSSLPVGSWGGQPENSGPRTAWCLGWSSGSPVAGSRTGWAPPTRSRSLLWWTAEPKQRH